LTPIFRSFSFVEFAVGPASFAGSTLLIVASYTSSVAGIKVDFHSREITGADNLALDGEKSLELVSV
jgi:hypothetical protein